MHIEAIIFDRDNTLLRFDEAAIGALEARIAAIAPSLSLRAVITFWLNWRSGWPRTPADEPAFWKSFWHELAREHSLASEAAERLSEIGGFYHTCFAAYDDTLACLNALRERGFRLAILTNFELPSVELTLCHAGINPGFFDAIISSAATGYFKPDARAFQAAADALGAEPAACAFVDDLVEHVEAARAIGMRAWQIRRELRHPAAPGVLVTLLDLLDLLPQRTITTAQ